MRFARGPIGTKIAYRLHGTGARALVFLTRADRREPRPPEARPTRSWVVLAPEHGNDLEGLFEALQSLFARVGERERDPDAVRRLPADEDLPGARCCGDSRGGVYAFSPVVPEVSVGWNAPPVCTPILTSGATTSPSRARWIATAASIPALARIHQGGSAPLDLPPVVLAEMVGSGRNASSARALGADAAVGVALSVSSGTVLAT